MLPFLPVWLLLMGSYLHFYWHTGPEALQRWATEGGYRIVRQERRTYRRGPFFWGSSGYQIVYRIRVQHPDGTFKLGWVRIGSYWLPDPSRIDERWDEPPPSPRDKIEGAGQGNPLMWDRELDAI